MILELSSLSSDKSKITTEVADSAARSKRTDIGGRGALQCPRSQCRRLGDVDRAHRLLDRGDGGCRDTERIDTEADEEGRGNRISGHLTAHRHGCRSGVAAHRVDEAYHAGI